VSYTNVNGMRSARYPLQGDCGCGCAGAGGCGDAGDGIGVADEPGKKYAWMIPVGVTTVVTLGVLFWKGKPKKNRRRR